MIYFTVICLIELQLLPYAHEAIQRGDSEQRVLKECMFQDLSWANKKHRFVSRFLMVCLLLNRREMVQQLLNQLRVVVDKRKRTFQLILYVLLCRQVNEKGNSYWEKNCHQILGLRKLFVPNKYEGRLWVAKNAKQPAPKPADMSISSNSLVKDGATCGAPKETRRHSLEEAMLFTVAEAAPPVARSCAVDFN
ncbi:hypothetical protein ACFX13_035152 [Malus domestica]